MYQKQSIHSQESDSMIMSEYIFQLQCRNLHFLKQNQLIHN